MTTGALVGAGNMGGVHLKAYARMEDVTLCALCDIRAEQTAAHAGTFGARQYTDLSDMLEGESLDFLDIATPSYLHKEMAMAAMNRGVNVVVEKPVALSERDAAELFDCAEKNGVKLMVAHVLRFWPEYRRLREAVEDGRYGEVLSARFFRIGKYPPWSWDHWMEDRERCGGVPYDLHIHDLDFAVSLLGLPEKIDVRRVLNREKNHPDHVFASYERQGAQVLLEAAWMDAVYPFGMGFLVELERAVLELRGGVLTVYPCEGEPQALVMEPEAGETGANLPPTDAYYEELHYFVDRVAKDEPIDCHTRAELCGVLRLLDTFYRDT